MMLLREAVEGEVVTFHGILGEIKPSVSTIPVWLPGVGETGFWHMATTVRCELANGADTMDVLKEFFNLRART